MNTFPPLPWMDPEAMQHMVRQQNLHLCGCLTVLASYAEPDGTIAYPKAVECLEAAPEMNERKAKKSLSRLVEAGWVTQTDDVVSITGCGGGWMKGLAIQTLLPSVGGVSILLLWRP